jgi:hypothetical protein
MSKRTPPLRLQVSGPSAALNVSGSHASNSLITCPTAPSCARAVIGDALEAGELDDVLEAVRVGTLEGLVGFTDGDSRLSHAGSLRRSGRSGRQRPIAGVQTSHPPPIRPDTQARCPSVPIDRADFERFSAEDVSAEWLLTVNAYEERSQLGSRYQRSPLRPAARSLPATHGEAPWTTVS